MIHLDILTMTAKLLPLHISFHIEGSTGLSYILKDKGQKSTKNYQMKQRRH